MEENIDLISSIKGEIVKERSLSYLSEKLK